MSQKVRHIHQWKVWRGFTLASHSRNTQQLYLPVHPLTAGHLRAQSTSFWIRGTFAWSSARGMIPPAASHSSGNMLFGKTFVRKLVVARMAEELALSQFTSSDACCKILPPKVWIARKSYGIQESMSSAPSEECCRRRRKRFFCPWRQLGS